MSNYAPVHHQTTSRLDDEGTTSTRYIGGANTAGTDTASGEDRDFNSARHTGTTRTTNDNNIGNIDYANQNNAGTASHLRHGAAQDDMIAPAEPRREPLSLNHEYAPRQEIEPRKDSLASTQGPFHVPTTDNAGSSGATLTSTVGQQNAPGKAGERGESVMGAIGFGGTHVERPKEEQGLGEKIVNFFGA